MKRIALLSFATAVAFSHFAAGENENLAAPRARHHVAPERDGGRPRVAPVAPRGTNGAPRPVVSPRQQFQQHAPRIPNVDRTLRPRAGDFNPTPRVQTPVAPAPVPAATIAPERNPEIRTAPEGNGRGQRDWRNGNGDVRNRDWQNGNGDARNRDGRNGNGEVRNPDWRNRNDADNHNRNRDRDHKGDHDGNHHGHHGWHGDWDHNHHHRDWWRSRYDRFVIFGGGYYYWNAGFWYPAYGYDSYYNTYAYDAPIYGYNDLPPGEVMAAMQTELARRGYYYGAIDGTYGPLTRAALLRYQEAYGLGVTGLLDEPTLQSLGID